MEKYKETCVRMISKDELAFCENHPGYIDFIVDDMTNELARRLMDVLSQIIVSDSELRVSDCKQLDSVEYRKQVTWSKLVRCKDCKYFDGQELCNRHFIFVGNDTSFFCRDGDWKDDPSHPFADDVMMGKRRE